MELVSPSRDAHVNVNQSHVVMSKVSVVHGDILSILKVKHLAVLSRSTPTSGTCGSTEIRFPGPWRWVSVAASILNPEFRHSRGTRDFDDV